MTASGRYRVIALTNNFNKKTLGEDLAEEYAFLGWDADGSATPASLRAMFDDFIDSSEVGMR